MIEFTKFASNKIQLLKILKIHEDGREASYKYILSVKNLGVWRSGSAETKVETTVHCLILLNMYVKKGEKKEKKVVNNVEKVFS